LLFAKPSDQNTGSSGFNAGHHCRGDDVTDAGLPALWKPWYAPVAVPAEHDFMQAIYAALAHTNDANQ
jgi:hypothetical protein